MPPNNHCFKSLSDEIVTSGGRHKADHLLRHRVGRQPAIVEGSIGPVPIGRPARSVLFLPDLEGDAVEARRSSTRQLEQVPG